MPIGTPYMEDAALSQAQAAPPRRSPKTARARTGFGCELSRMSNLHGTDLLERPDEPIIRAI